MSGVDWLYCPSHRLSERAYRYGQCAHGWRGRGWPSALGKEQYRV